MHRVDEGPGVFDRGFGEHAVAEIEDVAGAAGGLVEDFPGAAADLVGVGQQHRGIEIALDRFIVADGSPGVVQPDPPIDADHGPARLTQQR